MTDLYVAGGVIGALLGLALIGWLTPSKDHQMYPRPKRKRRSKENRAWMVRYNGLVYDSGRASWTQYYHTKTGARISAFFHVRFKSWGVISGGSVHLIKNKPS